jgi:hypothetical protein
LSPAEDPAAAVSVRVVAAAVGGVAERLKAANRAAVVAEAAAAGHRAVTPALAAISRGIR